uniref:BAG domain-containing protein n=1 Tax=Fagus sylvatica TaxID=28930 RepID=A0A2N9IDP7_FAGSY
MNFTQFHHPGMEVMKSDAANPHLAYECRPWPYGGNYGSNSMPWHSCCNHNSFTGYYSFRPPYPHFPPPSPMPCCGGHPHPAYHEAYPVHYIPPPHYSMEQYMPGNYNCCACPNHAVHSQKEDKSVKIEEQVPEDFEMKGSESLEPIQEKNYPYPFVWIPPEYMKGKEHRKPFESETDQVQAPLATTMKPHESLESNGWFPLDIGSLLQGADEKRNQNQQNEDKRTQFPFPIIWMPSSYDKKGETGKKDNREMGHTPETAKDKETPYTFKFIPLNPPQSHDFTNEPTENEKNSESQADSEVSMGEKGANPKSIPVKQMELHKDDSSEDTQSRGRSVNTINKRQSSSPPKTSRLPPVCLRVDPLFRNKNGNGRSRSSSPPAPKGHSKETSNVSSTSTAASSLKNKTLQVSKSQDSNKEVQPGKKENVIEVVERKTSEDKDKDLRDGSQTQFLVDPLIDSQEVSTKSTEEQIEAKKGMDSAKIVGDEGKFKKKTLSDEEAAVLIQSAYHGYEVRKWEPLKKLKKIAEVHQQVTDVRNRIQNLESSSDLQRDDKQKLVIGETIMRLLLELDTIQGLHPIVRDIRKSLVRELVTLQEKLDSLMIKKPEKAEERAEEVEGLGKSSPERNCNSSLGLVEAHKSMLPVVSSCQTEETLGSTFNDKEGHEKPEDENSILPVASGAVLKEAEPQQIMEQKVEVLNGELDFCQEAVKGVENENIVYPELEQSSELPLVGEEKIKSETEFTGVTDEEPTVLESQKDDQISMAKNEVQQNWLEELPLGVTNDGPAFSKFEKHEQVETDGDGKFNVTVDVISPDDENQTLTQLVQQPLDIPEEEKSIAESIDCVNIGNQKYEELPGVGNATLAVEPPPRQIDSNELQVASELVDPQPTIPVVKTEGHSEVHGDVYEGVNDANYTCSPVLEDAGVTTPEMEVPFWENKDNVEPRVSLGEEKKDAMKEAQEEDEHKSQDEEVVIDQAIGTETKEEEVPLYFEKVEGQGEPLPLSPAAGQVSVNECNLGMESDKKLIEENEKLREMMEKLIAAGKEQLTVISNLTGRVKDLEKKLAKKKKLRARHYGKAKSRSSCV